MSLTIPYYAVLLHEIVLRGDEGSFLSIPIEICEYILTFCDDRVEVIHRKDLIPIGFLYCIIKMKPMKDIISKQELDICCECSEWRRRCRCQKNKLNYLRNVCCE